MNQDLVVVLVSVGTVVLLALATVRIVPEGRRVAVYRLGRFRKLDGPGLIFIVPVLDRLIRIRAGASANWPSMSFRQAREHINVNNLDPADADLLSVEAPVGEPVGVSDSRPGTKTARGVPRAAFWVGLTILVFVLVSRDGSSESNPWHTGLMGLAGLILLVFGWRNLRLFLLIKRVETSPISHLGSGLVEIRGNVSDESTTIESPMSGRSCVYYHFVVTERAGKHRSTIVDDKRCGRCFVRDESGVAEVALGNAKVVLGLDSRSRSGLSGDVSASVETMLRDRYGQSTKGLIFDKNLEYEERILEVGDPLYVLGNVSPSSGKHPRIDSGGPVFLVSDRSEGSLVGRFAVVGAGSLVGAAVLFYMLWISL